MQGKHTPLLRAVVFAGNVNATEKTANVARSNCSSDQSMLNYFAMIAPVKFRSQLC